LDTQVRIRSGLRTQEFYRNTAKPSKMELFQRQQLIARRY
jgi:hypothetical protein